MTLLELEKIVSELQIKFESLSLQNKQQLTYPLDDTSQRIIKDILGASSGGMTLVSSGSFTGNTVIKGLNGDSDKIYKLIVTADHSTGFYMDFQINEDTGSNYQYLRHYGSKQNAILADNVDYNSGTVLRTSFIDQKNNICEMYISAVSGKKRITASHCVGIDASTNYYDTVNTVGVWTNTTDSIESITIKTGTVTNGNYFLFKL